MKPSNNRVSNKTFSNASPRPGKNTVAAVGSKAVVRGPGPGAAELRQLLDPCHSPPAPLPDKWHGRSEIITTTHIQSFAADGAGNRVVAISIGPEGQIRMSGVSVWATENIYDNPQKSNMVSDYKFVRCVGLCARLTKRSAMTTASGTAFYACMPDHSALPASITATLALLEQNKGQALPVDESPEIGWCPRSEDDFCPYNPDVDHFSTSTTDESGRLVYRRPKLVIALYGMTASTTEYDLVVTARFEAFLVATKQIRGGDNYVQNSLAMDTLLSKTHDSRWVTSGDEVQRRAQYAERRSKEASASFGTQWLGGLNAKFSFSNKEEKVPIGKK